MLGEDTLFLNHSLGDLTVIDPPSLSRIPFWETEK
jgi:hypothetical protein